VFLPSPAHPLLPRGRFVDAALVGGVVALAVLGGIAAVRYPTSVLLAAGLLVLFAATSRFPAGPAASFLVVLAAVPIATGLTIDSSSEGVTASSDVGLLKSIDDLVLIPGFLLLIARGLGIPREFRLVGVVALTALVGSELSGFVASEAPLRVQLEAAWQDFRWLGAIGWGMVLIDWIPRRSRANWTLAVLVGWNVVNLAVVAVQLAAGSTSSRFSIPVVSGAFGHPTPGAIAATMLLVFVLSDLASSPPRLSRSQIRMAIAIALPALILSLRFKPLLALAATLLLILFVRHGRWYVPAALVLASLPVWLTLAVVELQNVDTRGASPTTNPLASAVAHAPPRALLMKGAEEIAGRSFPFGGGLGTYGSGLNDAVEQRSFDSVGLGATDGFNSDNPRYRADSLVARNLAERGVLGMILWLVGMAGLIVLALRLGGGHLFPAAALVSALALAPVSPSLKATNEVMLYLLPAALMLLPRPSRLDEESEANERS
jgi:hypothetical protein